MVISTEPGVRLGNVQFQGAAHMEESAIRVALYASEVAPTEPDPEPSLYLIDKWDRLEKALESDTEVVAVAFHEVLGDHFTELVVNLGRIAESGKRLQMMRPSPFLRMQNLVERDG